MEVEADPGIARLSEGQDTTSPADAGAHAAGHLLRRRQASLALGAALLVYAGLWLMHRVADPLFLPWWPTGILADVFPNPWWVLSGVLVGLVGCVGAFYSLACFDQAEPPAPALSSGMPRPRWVRIAGLAPAGLALAILGYVVWQATEHQAGIPVLLLGLLATPLLAILVIEFVLPSPRVVARSVLQRLSPVEWAIILIAALAFIVLNERDAYNWRYAYIGDEWAFYGMAESIAHGSPFDLLSQAGVYGIHPLANSAYQALVMHIFGINVFGWRMAATLSVALPIAPLFWLARQLGDTFFALTTIVFYAGCSLLWAFAHIGYNNNDPLLVSIPAAALLYAGLRLERGSLLFAAGACAGVAWYSLFTGRLMIAVLVLVVIGEWRGGRSHVLRCLAFVLGGFAVVVLPLAVDNGWDTIHQMFALVNLSQARTESPVSSLLAQNTVRGVFAFLYATESTHYVVGEVFDPISACALCLGFTIALRRLRDRGVRLALIWFLSGLMLSTPLYYAPQIADTRLQFAIPPAALLAAIGLRAAARAARTIGGWPVLYPIVMVTALIGALILNGYHFYVTVPRTLNEDVIALDLGAMDAAPQQMIILVGDSANNNLCQVLDGYGKNTGAVLHFQDQRLQPLCLAYMDRSPTYYAQAMVVMDKAGLQAVTRCHLLLWKLAVSPNHDQTAWGYHLWISIDPKGAYLDRLAGTIKGRCSRLSTLRQG